PGEHQALSDEAHDQPSVLCTCERVAHLGEAGHAADQCDHGGTGDRGCERTDHHVAGPDVVVGRGHRTTLRASAPTAAPPITSATQRLGVAMTKSAPTPGYACQPALAARVVALLARPMPVT